jgi:hypothetical protein
MAHSILAVALLLHGIGHILFVMNAWGYSRTEAGQGWLFSQVLHGGQTTEGILGLLWLVPLAGFLVGTWGFYIGAAGWQPWLLASAVISSVLVLLWWGSINTSSAFFALVFNLIVIGIVLWQRQGAPFAG